MLSVKTSTEFTNSRISSLSINTSSPSGVPHRCFKSIEVTCNNNNNNNNNNDNNNNNNDNNNKSVFIQEAYFT